MRKPSKTRDTTYSPSADSEPITKENYAKRAYDFGMARDSFFVLRREPSDGRPTTHAQWKAWLIYLKGKYIPTDFMEKAKRYQAPAEWPEDFDPEARPSDRDFVYPPEPKIPPSERAYVLEGLRRLSESLKVRPDPSRPNNRTQRTPEEVLADAYAHAKTQPPVRLSNALLATLVAENKIARPEPPQPVYEGGEF